MILRSQSQASSGLSAKYFARSRWNIEYARFCVAVGRAPIATVFTTESGFTSVANPVTAEVEIIYFSCCGSTGIQRRVTTLREAFRPQQATSWVSQTVAPGTARCLHDAATAWNHEWPDPTAKIRSSRPAKIQRDHPRWGVGSVSSRITWRIRSLRASNVAANVVNVFRWHRNINHCTFGTDAVTERRLSGAVLNPHYNP